ncbi:MAG: hypothetical protein NC313_10825 [Butyrivibrio sp.]|nr:hypothetical protein [Butyrivibrio sp.]
MDGLELKEVMEQIHISPKMQEEIIMNVKKQMKHGKKKAWNIKKIAAAAASFVLAIGIISILLPSPAQAMVSSFVKARMESIPKEKVQETLDMIRAQDAVADGFSRVYSENEEERSHELWQAYENGTFPEKEIIQVDSIDAVIEGELCYVNVTGDFYLPEREMTDEELLEIIDLQHKMKYAVEQSPAAMEARAEMEMEEEQLNKIIQESGGISAEEAIEIAQAQMELELGDKAEGKELLRYNDGTIAVRPYDISGQTAYAHDNDIAYIIGFGNPVDRSGYTCTIDAIDGSILHTSAGGEH